jgi:hypothetical protein
LLQKNNSGVAFREILPQLGTPEMVTNSKLLRRVMLANELWPLALIVFIFPFIIPFSLCYTFSPVFYDKLTCIRINKVVFRTAICCFI